MEVRNALSTIDGTVRVLRGDSDRHDGVEGFRWLWRDHGPPDRYGDNLGFRVARSAVR